MLSLPVHCPLGGTSTNFLFNALCMSRHVFRSPSKNLRSHSIPRLFRLLCKLLTLLSLLRAGIIERSAIDGQKVYHGELEKAMRAYIQDHKSEFLPEGIDAAVIVEPPPEAATAGPIIAGVYVEPTEEKDISDEQSKRRERERNARSLQWAYDTFDGAWQVGMRSAKGAIELIRDAWDQSTSTTILWFVIVILVISNLWTLLRVSSSHADAERRIELRKVDDREKWVHTVVTALWEELEAGKRAAAGSGEFAASTLAAPPSAATEPALPPVAQTRGQSPARFQGVGR